MPLVAFAKPLETTELEIPVTPKQMISLYAQKYGASETELMRVAKCESNFNPKAIHYNDGGKGKHSFGIYQYQESTFRNFSKLAGEEYDYYSYLDQIKLTAQIFAEYPSLKNHWECYSMIY